jgi:hypothetical protein
MLPMSELHWHTTAEVPETTHYSRKMLIGNFIPKVGVCSLRKHTWNSISLKIDNGKIRGGLKSPRLIPAARISFPRW